MGVPDSGSSPCFVSRLSTGPEGVDTRSPHLSSSDDPGVESLSVRGVLVVLLVSDTLSPGYAMGIPMMASFHTWE